LSKLSEKDIYYELYESKKTIENILNHNITSISYPVGNNNSYDERVVNIARECGYEFGITYNHLPFLYDESKKYHIPRVHVETYMNLSLFKANILIPYIFL
jgi:peptidoglycan/xylan/chitin deacetylase (PgdA/CDA1 family)